MKDINEMRGTCTTEGKKLQPLTFGVLKRAIDSIGKRKEEEHLIGIVCSPEGFKELTELAVDERKTISKPGLLFTSCGIDLFINRQQKFKFLPIWEGERKFRYSGEFRHPKGKTREKEGE